MSDEPKSGFTRRDLVRGALVGAAAAAVPAKAPAAPANRAIGPQAVPISLQINGKTETSPRRAARRAGRCLARPHRPDGHEGRLRARRLRRLHGHRGRESAQCSCLLLAVEMPGRSITTIEGLKTDNRLSPIQEAFVNADALQCGFCTSGMVMSCKVLLDKNPKPSRDEIREAVAGNLCRCGTYPHVLDAVERAAGIKTAGNSLTILEPMTMARARHGSLLATDAGSGRQPSKLSTPRRPDMGKEKIRVGFDGKFESKEIVVAPGDPAPWDPSQKFSILGTRVPRLDGPAKVSGQARYSIDVRLPGMLYGKILRSPYPAATVVSIDLDAAKKMPGVKAAIPIAKAR